MQVLNSSLFHSLSLQGICPGNRLKIISSYEATSRPSPVSSPCPSMPSIYYNNSILSSADSILYENTVGYGHATSPNHLKHGKRRSWHIMPNKVLYFIIIILSIKNCSVIINQKTLCPMDCDALSIFIWPYILAICVCECECLRASPTGFNGHWHLFNADDDDDHLCEHIFRFKLCIRYPIFGTWIVDNLNFIEWVCSEANKIKWIC